MISTTDIDNEEFRLMMIENEYQDKMRRKRLCNGFINKAKRIKPIRRKYIPKNFIKNKKH